MLKQQFTPKKERLSKLEDKFEINNQCKLQSDKEMENRKAKLRDRVNILHEKFADFSITYGIFIFLLSNKAGLII